MAASTYVYCYGPCPIKWLTNHTEFGIFGGVVGYDHKWLKDGMPCGPDGLPHEFAVQDENAVWTKQHFPQAKVLEYRIISAVPYDNIVHDKMLSDPDFFIRWHHPPHNNGSICHNYIHHVGGREDGCAYDIHAATYDWSRAGVQEWYVKNIIAPTLKVADGAWLDGNGPGNGAWMCAGSCCGFDATNSPQNQSEIDAWKQGEEAAFTAAQKYLVSNGGFDYNCFTFIQKASELPVQNDSAASCAAKLTQLAKIATTSSYQGKKVSAVVLYGSRTSSAEYDDSTVHQAVAAFMLVRADHWFFGMPSQVTLKSATAKLLLSDYGMPQGKMMEVPGKTGVFQRVYKEAMVQLDCNDFSAQFMATMAV